jgi:uncharacterized membrane protein
MATRNDGAAGVPTPAAGLSGTWVDWRERADRPLYRVTLWPNRSLSRGGQRGVMLLAAGGFSLPLMGAAAASAAVFWGLLPFCAMVLGVLWLAFRRSNRDGGLEEELTLWRDEMRVERREPRGRVLRWRAEPAFVRLTLHPDAKLENYLTLRGGGREIELGAFLAPEERVALRDEIEAALARAR